MRNFPAKWVTRLGDLLTWWNGSSEKERAVIDRYMNTVDLVREARVELAIAASNSGTSSSPEVRDLQERVTSLESDLAALRDRMEESLEGAVSGVIVAQDLNVAGEFIWPPVDVRLDETPFLLVTSPRDRIERRESVLLESDIQVNAMEDMETALLREENLSAVVIKIGGVATYPAVLPDDASLERLLELTAHEWLHNYLFFHPLGQAMFNNNQMSTLNETLANMFGREVGRLAYERLTGIELPQPDTHGEQAAEPDPQSFNFNEFMHETRLRTDELLEQKKVEEAEQYMELRRIELNSHGYVLRKLNQAWFAFHGTYADSPSSVSPIAGELESLRAAVHDVGDMVRLLRSVSSYEEFRKLLGQQSPISTVLTGADSLLACAGSRTVGLPFTENATGSVILAGLWPAATRPPEQGN